MLCRIRVRIKPHMTVPQSESSGFFMVVLPMVGPQPRAPGIFCPSEADCKRPLRSRFLPRALDSCVGAALRKRDIEELAGRKTRAAQHDPARAVPDDAVAALQHRRRIQVRQIGDPTGASRAGAFERRTDEIRLAACPSLNRNWPSSSL